MSSTESRFQRLQDEIADLLDRADHGTFLQRSLHLIKARQLIDHLNKLSGHNADSPQLRTLEQAYKELATGRLR